MSELTLDVRPVTPADVELMTSRETEQNAGSTAEHTALAGDHYHFIGAFTDDDVVGYVVLDHRDEAPLLPQMKRLWVYPEYRRRGVGQQLTHAIEKIAAAAGFDEVLLSVDPDESAAIPLYLNLDYTPTGHHRVMETDENDEPVRTEAIYRKSLTLRAR